VERLPTLTAEEQRAGMALLAELSRGRPVTRARLAQALAVEETEAEQYLRDSGLSRLVHSDEQGSALGFFGLSTLPTDHRSQSTAATCGPGALPTPSSSPSYSTPPHRSNRKTRSPGKTSTSRSPRHQWNQPNRTECSCR
jgi:hypothetical protein